MQRDSSALPQSRLRSAMERAEVGASNHPAARLLIERLEWWFFRRWYPRANDGKPWKLVGDDYAVALQMLRFSGWAPTIPVALGFALHQCRIKQLDARLRTAGLDAAAYAAEGHAWLLDQRILLHDPLVSQFDSKPYLPIGLRDLDTARYQHMGGWRCLRTDLLPQPQSPYVGESQDVSAYPEIASWLGRKPPSPPESTELTNVESAQLDVVGTAKSRDDFEGWKAITAELGFSSDREARRRLEEHGIQLRKHGREVVGNTVEIQQFKARLSAGRSLPESAD
jgi:hypothetical protein